MKDEFRNSQEGTIRPIRWKRRVVQLVLVGGALLFALSLTAKRPKNLGIIAGQLTKCPESPNCVSTTAERESQRMAPLRLEGEASVAMDQLLSIINELPRAQVVSQTEDYLYVEFVSLVFRYVDDVEFLIDAENGKIDFRSASRVGYSDLGANRRRMKFISERFHQ